MLLPPSIHAEEDKMDAVMTLMNPAYRLKYHRQTYGDDAYQVMLPVASTLEEDDTLLPPLPVDGQACAPKKLGPKKFKRIAGRGDKYASSSFNTRDSELGPAASGTTAAPSLSQGVPQRLPLRHRGGVRADRSRSGACQNYGDDAYQVMLPVASTLEEDDTLLPPLPVDGQACAPKKLGPKKFKRIAGRGDKYASSSFNTRDSELGPAASGTTAAPSLSQGVPQRLPLRHRGGVRADRSRSGAW
ncbi:unnamed protein product [Ectocarpus sp. CCAP 1310/34]|nr:unnamed protein product [Ectocarpus sp. CCAP 1310/34]